MPRPRAHAPNKQGGKPAGQETSSYTHTGNVLHARNVTHRN